MSEQVYVVRLPEEERELILDTPPARGPHSPSWRIYKNISDRLESARPEHPERQAALEELGQVASLYRDGGSNWVELTQAVDNFRSLETK